MIATKEEALQAALKQISDAKWKPEPIEPPDIGTELVLYLMEKNAVLKEALEAFVSTAVITPETHRVSSDEWVLSKCRAALRDSGSHSKSRDTK